jgi:hypothetical protein
MTLISHGFHFDIGLIFWVYIDVMQLHGVDISIRYRPSPWVEVDFDEISLL